MLLPNILEKARSALPWLEDITFTMSSGKEEPKATMVNPMVNSVMPSLLAMIELASTSQSAPLIKITKPRTNRQMAIIMRFY